MSVRQLVQAIARINRRNISHSMSIVKIFLNTIENGEVEAHSLYVTASGNVSPFFKELEGLPHHVV